MALYFDKAKPIEVRVGGLFQLLAHREKRLLTTFSSKEVGHQWLFPKCAPTYSNMLNVTVMQKLKQKVHSKDCASGLSLNG